MGYEISELMLSDSSRNSAKSCMRKLEFAKFHGVNFREGSLAGDAGTALHAGYQSYWINGDPKLAAWEMMKAYPIQFNDNPNDPRSIQACYSALRAMIQSDKLDGYELAYVRDKKGELIPAVEIPFLINFVDIFLDPANKKIPIKYRGFIDLILYNRLENSYCVVDIKTTRKQMNDYTALFKWDDQCIPYAFALSKAIGHKITTLNIKYLVVYIDILEPKVQLLEFDKGENDFREWTMSFINDLTSIQTFYNAGFFPRNGKSCTAFNNICKYWSLCESRNPKTIQMMLEHLKSGKNSQEEPPFDPVLEIDISFSAEAA